MDFSKEEVLRGAKFLVFLMAVFAVLYGIFYFVVPLEWSELAVAQAVIFLMNLFGAHGTIASAAEPVLIDFRDFKVEIGELCTGILELVVLVSAIAATPFISWRKKLYGAVAAFVGVNIFNLARIVVSINILINSSVETAVFTHDVLFRVSLIVVIAGFYGAWYWLAAGVKKVKKPRKRRRGINGSQKA